MKNHQDELRDRITSYYTGNASGEEIAWLENWIDDSAENRMFFRQTLLTLHRISLAEMDELGDAMRAHAWEHIRQSHQKRRIKRQLWVRYAAIVVLLIASGLFYDVLRHEYTQQSGGDMLAQKQHVVLKTADGEVIEIKRNDSGFYASQSGNFSIEKANNEVIFVEDSLSKTGRHHQLEVLRGGEYKLRLEDGTSVFLNSESTIRFPESFALNSREIEITGEVYLHVAKDSARPFVVRAGGLTTEVLGTCFAIQVYPEDPVHAVTLKEGRVKVSHGQHAILLEPGYKAVLENDLFQKQAADISKELAWVDGYFCFELEPLETVLIRLSRWYDVQFSYDDESLKHAEFTGKMNRDIGIQQILTLIEKVNLIQFEKEGDHYVVKNKRQNWKNNQ